MRTRVRLAALLFAAVAPPACGELWLEPTVGVGVGYGWSPYGWGYYPPYGYYAPYARPYGFYQPYGFYNPWYYRGWPGYYGYAPRVYPSPWVGPRYAPAPAPRAPSPRFVPAPAPRMGSPRVVPPPAAR